MEKKDNSKKTVLYSSILVLSITLLGLVLSYGWAVNIRKEQEIVNVNAIDGLTLSYLDCRSTDQTTCANINKDLAIGESVDKYFEITNTSQREIYFSIYFTEVLNTFKNDELVYTLTLEKSTSSEEIVPETPVPYAEEKKSNELIATNIMIPSNTTQKYRLTIKFLEKDYNQNENLNAVYMLKTGIGNNQVLTPSEETLAKLGKSKKTGTPDFSAVATTDETSDGLYNIADDYGTSYYYRGNVSDNYVKFAEFYWRIIRVNGDGSLRLIYDGTSAHANSESSTDRLALTSVAWNTINHDDAKYVGYMYGGANGTASTSKEQAQTNETDTNIKTQLETWYKTNIADRGYDGYVSDNIFCNDRSTPGSEATGWSADTGLGYGTNATGYGGFARSGVQPVNYDKVQPQLICPNKNDAFTKEDTEKGNGKLGEKVGMITADEIVLAGSGKYGTANQSYYLHKGNWYWSLSPRDFAGSYAGVFFVNNTGDLRCYSVNIAGGVAPVINLSKEAASQLKGTGTKENPYIP